MKIKVYFNSGNIAILHGVSKDNYDFIKKNIGISGVFTDSKSIAVTLKYIEMIEVIKDE